MKWLNQQLKTVLLLSACALICISIFIGKLPNLGSDPYGALVVSQNIIQNHSLRLDNVASYWTDRYGPKAYHIFEKDHHTYYSYPYGTPLISIPFVFIGNLFGIDMRRSERVMQTIICCVVAMGVFLTVYMIAHLYFPMPVSIIIGLIGFYGTTVGTVVGTGLWNLDYDILFSGCAVLLSLLSVKKNYRIKLVNIDILPILIGISLFLAFISRPTSSILIMCIFILFLIYDRSALLKMAISSAILLFLYVVMVYIKIPTAMYTFNRFSFGDAAVALKTFLWSPSRSVLIFNPFIILLPIFTYYFIKNKCVTAQIKALALAILLSCTLIFVLLLFWGYWYGGWCFGPRIFADGIYWSFLALVIVMGEVGYNKTYLRSNAIFKVLAVAMVIGFAINIQGIFNGYALAWNAYPVVDKNPIPVLFDWRFPQFFMTKKRLAEKYVIQGNEFGIIPKPEQVASNVDKINRAVGLYLRAGKALDSLYPITLEKMGLLDASFGGYPVGKSNDNWTRNGYWLRSWGKDTYAIGFQGAVTDQVKYLYGIYSKRSQAIYFPFPKAFSPKTTSRFKMGFMVIVFKRQQSVSATYGQQLRSPGPKPR